MNKFSDFIKKSEYKKTLVGMIAGIAVLILAIGMASGSGSSDQADKGSKEEAVADTSTEATATPQASNELQKNADEKVSKLVNDYLTASKEGNIEHLKTLVSNSEDLTKEQVQRPYEYVEKIQNVDCYTLSGVEEGSYIVYVYYELKFVNVDTVAPGLLQLYVAPTSDGNLVIMLDELDHMVEEAREAALEREDVKQLINMVNANLTEAVNKDADLNALVTKMNTEETAAKATQAPAASPEATKAAK